ncbi:MAG: hypothetical protein PVG19_11675 [Desulfobacterales bacterium]|jgi:hypothetical protein
MLPSDSLEAATQAAGPFSDRRVRHFFDPHKEVGKAIAEGLGWAGQIARDIYLFYAPGQKWDEHPPSPVAYAHQLTNAWADRDHYRVAADLTDELRKSMGKLIRRADQKAFSLNG